MGAAWSNRGGGGGGDGGGAAGSSRNPFSRTTSDPVKAGDNPHVHSSRYATSRFQQPLLLPVVAGGGGGGGLPLNDVVTSPRTRVMVRGNFRRFTSGLGRSFRKIHGRPKLRGGGGQGRSPGWSGGGKSGSGPDGEPGGGASSPTTAEAFVGVLAAVRKGDYPIEVLLDAMASLSERLYEADSEVLFKHLASPSVLEALVRVVLRRADDHRTAVVMDVLVSGPPRFRKAILLNGDLREPLFRFLECPTLTDDAEPGRMRNAAASETTSTRGGSGGLSVPSFGVGVVPAGAPPSPSCGSSLSVAGLPWTSSFSALSGLQHDPYSPVRRSCTSDMWAAGMAMAANTPCVGPVHPPTPHPQHAAATMTNDLSVVAERVTRLLAALLNDAPDEFARAAAKRRSFAADVLSVCAGAGCVFDLLPPLFSAKSYYSMAPPEDLRYGATNAVGVVLLADADVLKLMVRRFKAAVNVVPATPDSQAAMENCLSMVVALSLRCIPPLRFEPSKTPDKATAAGLGAFVDRLSVITRPAHLGALLDTAFGAAPRDGGLALRRTLGALTELFRTIRAGALSPLPGTRGMMAALDTRPMERELAARIPALAGVLRSGVGVGDVDGGGQRQGTSRIAASVAGGEPAGRVAQRDAPLGRASGALPFCSGGGGGGDGATSASPAHGRSSPNLQSSPLSSVSPSWNSSSSPASPVKASGRGGGGGLPRISPGAPTALPKDPGLVSIVSVVATPPSSPSSNCPAPAMPGGPPSAISAGSVVSTSRTNSKAAPPLCLPAYAGAGGPAADTPSFLAPVGTAYEWVRSPLGSTRLAVLDLLSLAFSSNCPEAHSALAATAVPLTLMELFGSLRWNSILHRSVAECVAVSLACPSTALHRAWLSEAELPARTLDLYARAFEVSTRRLRRPRTQPAAYVGDVMRMADAMRLFLVRHRLRQDRGEGDDPGGRGRGSGTGPGSDAVVGASDGGPLVRGVCGASVPPQGPSLGAATHGGPPGIPTAYRDTPAAAAADNDTAAPVYTPEALLDLFGPTPAEAAEVLKALDAFNAGTLKTYVAQAVKPLGGARPTVHSASVFAPLTTNCSLNVD